MSILVVLLLVLGAFWIGKEFAYARRRQAFLASRDSHGRPMLPPHERFGQEKLAQRAADLRMPVVNGHIAYDEALGSLMRYAGPALSVERARMFLDGR